MTPSRLRIDVPRDKLADFCRRHHIRRLAFFRMQDELSEIIGRRVDLNTVNELSRYFRDEVLSEAEPVYGPAR